MEHFKSSSINFGPKWVARVRQLALRSQSPVVIYKKEYYSSSNQTQILKLSIRRRQSNLIIVFTFCSLRRKKLLSCRFGRIAQFHCHSYCKHSHRRCQSTSFFSHFSFPIFELGGMTKHLMTAPSGNSDPTTVGRFFSFLSPSFSPSPPPPPLQIQLMSRSYRRTVKHLKQPEANTDLLNFSGMSFRHNSRAIPMTLSIDNLKHSKDLRPKMT